MSRRSSPRTSMLNSLSGSTCSALHLNVTVLGQNGSGKSALVVKYLTRRFIWEYHLYLENTYPKAEMLQPEGIEIQLSILDTYDRESLEIDKLSRWSHLIVVVYSITSRSSFYRARELLESLKQDDVTCVLLGNKLDLEQYRFVGLEEGRKLAADYDCNFTELSCTDEFEPVREFFCSGLREVLKADKLDSNGFGPCSSTHLHRHGAAAAVTAVTAASAAAMVPGAAVGYHDQQHTHRSRSPKTSLEWPPREKEGKQNNFVKKNSTATMPLRFFRDKFTKK